ncbi:MAG: DUF378 domain-containing protein [Syntrophomonadaceae bacterium]|nr:DUF378 domain-containing protein [Syntrophomonadaceae bacterium]
MNTSAIDKTALILVIIGALNWGLVGLFQYDLIAAIFGSSAALASRVIYTLIGLAGIYSLIPLFRDNRIEARDVRGDDR